MSRIIACIMVVSVMALGSCCQRPPHSTLPSTNSSDAATSRPAAALTLPQTDGVRTSDLTDAVSLGLVALAKQTHYSSKTGYTLTVARRFYRDGHYVWLVTFKPTAPPPTDPATGEITEIALGGEVFVTVDLRTKKTVVTYGE